MDDPVLVDDLRPSKPPPASVYDDMFESYFNRAVEPSPKASSSSSTPPPVFDKPVFDDDPNAVDPFDGIPLFGAGGGSDDREEDFLGGLGSAEKSEERRDPKAVGFDDKLFPGLGGSARSTEPVRDAVESDSLIPGLGGSAKPLLPVEPEEVVLDDGVIPGFRGSTNHHHSARDDCMTRQEREPVSSSKMSVSMPEDPFVISRATLKSEYSSFGLFSDYLDNITIPAKSENTKVDAPANTSGRFQGSDMFAGFPKAMPSFSFVSEKESDTTGRRSVNSVNSMSQSNNMPVQQGSGEATANILPEMNISEQYVIHEVPIVNGFQTLNPFAMDDPLPDKNGYSKMLDDVWLTVSDITLVTQPTSAPPPSRPPPQLVTKQPPTESVTTKTYPHHHNQGYHHSVGSMVTLKSSQFNELEDFFMPKSAKFANGYPRVLNHKGTEQYSSTGTANFLGQSDLRNSKGMNRGDFGSVFSSSQYQQEEIDEKSEFCVHEMEKMYGDNLLENERKQREHDEEQRRAERERIEELEQEREKVRQREQEEKKRHEKEREARQAVERAIREARERAAVEAHMRAESEACQRAERAAVQKAAAEARERAAVDARERAAKSAAEAKERATADARERDARAAAEAREKAAAESQDKATAEAQAKAERSAAAEAVEKANREARERAVVEARMRAESEARQRAERAAVQKATAEARERAAVEARERAAEAKERASEEDRKKATWAADEAREKAVAESQEKAAAEARAKGERAAVAKATAEARRRAERAAFERVAAQARQRAAVEARARENQQKTATVQPDLESFFGMPSGSSSVPKSQTATTNPFDVHPQGSSGSGTARTAYSVSASSFMQPSSSNLMDDLSSIPGDIGGEREERRKPGLEREQRIMERAAKALAEKNERDLQAQWEQEERHRIGETIDFEIKRWAAGKEGNIQALLSTLQYILWPECGWRPVSLTDLMTAASVKKEYRKATLCIHPDKVQQKGANLQQRYIAEKVFDLLKEAWNKFNSEGLF